MRWVLVIILILSLFSPSPAAASGDPPMDLAFIQTLPLLFQGWCFGNDNEDGLARRFPCEVRGLEKRLWPQELYYLIVSSEDGREVLAISTFRVSGDKVLWAHPEK